MKTILQALGIIRPKSPFDALQEQLEKNVAVNIFDIEHFRMMSHDKLIEFFAKNHTEEVDADKVENKRLEIIANAKEELEVALDQLSSICAIQHFRPDAIDEHGYEAISTANEYIEFHTPEEEPVKLEVEDLSPEAEKIEINNVDMEDIKKVEPSNTKLED